MGATRTPLWLPALRDVLSMWVLLAAYMGAEVAWRGHTLRTDQDERPARRRVQFAQRQS